MSTYLVQFDSELSPADRRRLKDWIGWMVRELAPMDTVVCVDHLGTPVTNLNQRPDRRLP